MVRRARSAIAARVWVALLLAGCAVGVYGPRAAAQQKATAPDVQPSRLTVLEENDSLYFNSDKHYTQGLRLSDLIGGTPAPGSLWDDGFNLLNFGPFFQAGGTRKTSVLAGQSIFTPKNLSLKPPDPRDRPYAGWLYGGVSMLQDTGLSVDNAHMLENFEIDFGMVGPGALGKLAQNTFHQFIGAQEAKGWSDQIQHEFGGMVSYERMWRLPLLGDNSFGVDIVPEAGATAGNVFTYGDIGATLRVGKGLQADYGPVRVRPALSGTDYFDETGLDNGRGWYFFVGTQGRAMGRNIFLDGNSFRTSRRVPKKTLVGDAEAGVSVLWSQSLRVDLSVTTRSEEFIGQHGSDDVCTAALTWSW
ncbi:MAG TPA: lipid A deacylase LpxR family protein [Stellaceae bacterium]|nr:lipid A deacylase LpxR family protein [Stellaceae bacterium]